MMIRRIAVAAVLIALVPAAGGAEPPKANGAQPGMLTWGVKGGINVATFGVSDGSPTGARLGPIAGAFVLFPITERLGIQAEGLYSVKGDKATVTTEAPYTFEYKLTYVDIPVLARVPFGKRGQTQGYLLAGAQVSVKLSATDMTRGPGASEQSTDLGSGVKGTDAAVVFGGGVQFRRLLVEGRYALGLVNVDATAGSSKTTNRVLSVLAGVRF